MSAAKKSVNLEKLAQRIEDGEFYEAHQMYRTVYARYPSPSPHPSLLKE